MSNPNVPTKNTGDTFTATELNSIVTSIGTKADSGSLAIVATSGDYNDLINIPSGSVPIWGQITGSITDQIDLNTSLNAKQNTLISSTNIKSINGNSLLGSGNLNLVPNLAVTGSGSGGSFTIANGPVNSNTNTTITLLTNASFGFYRVNTYLRADFDTSDVSASINFNDESGDPISTNLGYYTPDGGSSPVPSITFRASPPNVGNITFTLSTTSGGTIHCNAILERLN